MKFEDFFQITIDKQNDNFIKNDETNIRYCEILNYFNQLDASLALDTLPPGSCVQFQLINNPLDILLLLYFLSKDINIYLSKSINNTHIPGYCNCQLIINHKLIKESNKLDFGETVKLVKIDSQPILKNSNNVILETSGSTNKSKYVLFEKEVFLNNAKNFLNHIGITQQDRVLISVPCYHMYGLGAALIPSLMAGASIFLLKNINVVKYIENEKDFNPSVVFQAPSMIQMLVKMVGSKKKYKYSVVAGDKVDKKWFLDYEEKFGCLINLYGSTELGAAATSVFNDSGESKAEGYIKFLNNVEHNLLTLSKNKYLLKIKHPYKFKCYIDNTGKVINKNQTNRDKNSEWYCSNDICSTGPNNLIKILGRYDNSINRNGKLATFVEIESMIDHGIKEIKKSIVIAGDENTTRGKKLILFYQLKEEYQNNPPDIRKFCFKFMDKAFVPDETIEIKEFPKLANGKINRTHLIIQYQNGKGKNNL